MNKLSKKTATVSPTTTAFVNAIRARMESEGLSQQELAERSGLSKAEVSHMMNFYTNPTTTVMDKFSNAAFNVDAHELIAEWHLANAALK